MRDGPRWPAIDVVKQPGEVRRHIGVAAQDATLDPLLTGRQNLVLVGELSDMGRAASKSRADRAAGAVRTDRRRRPGAQGLFGWHAPAAGPGRIADDATPGAVPGRADDGLGPDEPTAGVGRHPRAARRRGDGAADDAVPRGGGRTGPPHRRGGPRAGHRQRHAPGAEGGEPERPPRGHAPGAAPRGGRRDGAAGRRSGPRERGRPAPECRRGRRTGPGHLGRTGARRRRECWSTTSRYASRRSTTCSSRSPAGTSKGTTRMATTVSGTRAMAADPGGDGSGRHELEGARA